MKKIIFSIPAASIMLSAVSFSVYASADDNAMPEHYDLRELGVVTPIKNKGAVTTAPFVVCKNDRVKTANIVSLLFVLILVYFSSAIGAEL